MGFPIGTDCEHFHLIAPFEKDPRLWDSLQWVDLYSGKVYRATTTAPHGAREVARVKSYGDVLREYEFHAESKCADAGGDASGKQSLGLLARRRIAVGAVKYIGKESNHLEPADEQSIAEAASLYTEYPDPRRDTWHLDVLPALKRTPLQELQALTGMSRAALQAIRAGRRPQPQNQTLLSYVVNRRANKTIGAPFLIPNAEDGEDTRDRQPR